MEITNETTNVENVSKAEGQSQNATETNTEAAEKSAATGGVPEAKAGGAGNDGAASKATGTDAQNQQAAYTPNFKFKVKDKELEFDDFLKPIIKTKDLETKARELYEKAHGLDEVKAARETFKTQAEEWKGKFTQVETSLQTLGSYVKKGDFRTFFQALNIPKEQIIKYAIEELKYQELPPEQKAAIDQQREREMALEQTGSQNQQLQQQMAQLVQQQATFELNQELAAPNVVQAMQAYDTRAGQAGAFKAEVIRRGQYYEAVHKISPPASQLVQEVLNLIGVTAQAQQGTQASSNEQSSQTVHNQQQKPVISSFSGGGTKSPTARKVPASIDDLRKMRQNLTT
jgi:hypothetical protein